MSVCVSVILSPQTCYVMLCYVMTIALIPKKKEKEKKMTYMNLCILKKMGGGVLDFYVILKCSTLLMPSPAPPGQPDQDMAAKDQTLCSLVCSTFNLSFQLGST